MAHGVLTKYQLSNLIKAFKPVKYKLNTFILLIRKHTNDTKYNVGYLKQMGETELCSSHFRSVLVSTEGLPTAVFLNLLGFKSRFKTNFYITVPVTIF